MLLKNKCGLVLCLTIAMLSVFGGQAFAKPSDIGGHWAEDKIIKWIDMGLINGYPDGTFQPDKSITRAEFAAMVNRAANYTALAIISFADVKPSDWYYRDISKAVAAGYVTGYEDYAFRPKNLITRQEAAVIIARVMKLDTTAADISGLKDGEAIPRWARSAVVAVVANGYMKGYPDGTFHGNRPISRAEAVVSLDNAFFADDNKLIMSKKTASHGATTPDSSSGDDSSTSTVASIASVNPTTLTEAEANDGSLASGAIVVTIANGALAADIAKADVTANNLPPGLD